jgi:hypothetical protein
MLLTQEKAKKLKCVSPLSGHDIYDTRFEDVEKTQRPERCCASECMAWRWVTEMKYIGDGESEEVPRSLGYCGLAGKPGGV